MASLIDKELKEYDKNLKSEALRTESLKGGFIREIKAGLGEEIKKTGNKVDIIERKKESPVKLFFKRLFKIF